MIFDIFEFGSGAANSGGRPTGKKSRLRKWGICLGLVVVAAGLKFFAFVPGMMQAAPLASIFAPPAPAPLAPSRVLARSRNRTL